MQVPQWKPSVENCEASLSPQHVSIWRPFHYVIPATAMLFPWPFEWLFPRLIRAVDITFAQPDQHHAVWYSLASGDITMQWRWSTGRMDIFRYIYRLVHVFAQVSSFKYERCCMYCNDLYCITMTMIYYVCLSQSGLNIVWAQKA